MNETVGKYRHVIIIVLCRYTAPPYTYRQHISLCILLLSEERHRFGPRIRDQNMNRLFTKKKKWVYRHFWANRFNDRIKKVMNSVLYTHRLFLKIILLSLLYEWVFECLAYLCHCKSVNYFFFRFSTILIILSKLCHISNKQFVLVYSRRPIKKILKMHE